MSDLPETGIPVMKALIGAPLAWQTPTQLASALGTDLEAMLDLLCNLDAAGWLDVWEDQDGPLITLSPLSAALLCVRIVEVGPSEAPRWAGSGDPDPPPLRSRGVFSSARSADLEYVIDPSSLIEIDVEEVAAGGEETEARAKARLKYEPRPRIFIGTSLSPWPGPSEIKKAICPACEEKVLRTPMYCLYCDRWGCDSQNAVVENQGQPKRLTTRKSSNWSKKLDEVQAEIERGRDRRKARRRNRANHRAGKAHVPRAIVEAPTLLPPINLGLSGPPRASHAKSPISK